MKSPEKIQHSNLAFGFGAKRLGLMCLAVLSVLAASLSSTVAAAGEEEHEKCTISGTEDADWIVGTSGPDVICAGDGDDVVWGLGGSDVIVGGDGNDVLVGGPGSDHLRGGAGDDVLDGSDGNDVLAPGGGADVLFSDAQDSGEAIDSSDVAARNGVDRLGAGRCEERARNLRCETLDYASDGYMFAAIEGWLDESLFAEAAAKVQAPVPVPQGREPVKGEIKAAMQARSNIGLASEPATIARLIRNHPRNNSMAMLGIPLTNEEWDQFLTQQATLEELTGFHERATSVEGFLTQRFSYTGNGMLTVWGTDPNALLLARDQLNPGLGDSVRVEKSEFSRKDLERFAATAIGLVEEPGSVRVRLDGPQSIKVEVNNDTGAARNPQRFASLQQQLRDIAPKGATVSAIAKPAVVEHLEVNCQQEGAAACHPTGGSLQVAVQFHDGRSGHCTSGPAVTRGATARGVLTSGHCVLEGERGTTDADVTRVGEIAAADWAFTAFRENATGNDQVYVNATNRFDIVGTQYVSPQAHQLLVRGARNPVVGELVCNSGLLSMREGRPTSERCGLVTDLGAVGGGTGFVEAFYQSCDGDSGGSIYSVRTPGASSDQVDVWIVGLHHGADGEGCTNNGSRFAQLNQALTGTGTAMANDWNPAGAYKRTLVDAYSTILQRSTGPDQAGFNYWTGLAGSNCNSLVNTMAHSFTVGAEYTQQLSSRASIWNSSTRINNRITDLYRAALHRSPSAWELNAWRGAVTGGTPEPNPSDEEARREANWVHVSYAISVSSQESNTRVWTPHQLSGQPAKCAYDLGTSSWN